MGRASRAREGPARARWKIRVTWASNGRCHPRRSAAWVGVELEGARSRSSLESLRVGRQRLTEGRRG
jgi:hypothetical protein